MISFKRSNPNLVEVYSGSQRIGTVFQNTDHKEIETKAGCFLTPADIAQASAMLDEVWSRMAMSNRDRDRSLEREAHKRRTYKP